MVDQSQIAIDLANGIVEQSGELMNAIEELQDIYDWREGADIDFTDFETEIAGQASLKHVEGGYLNKVSGAILTNLVDWLKTETLTGGPLDGKTYWEALQMTRKNGSQ